MQPTTTLITRCHLSSSLIVGSCYVYIHYIICEKNFEEQKWNAESVFHAEERKSLFVVVVVLVVVVFMRTEEDEEHAMCRGQVVILIFSRAECACCVASSASLV